MTLNEVQQIVDEYLEMFPAEAQQLARLQQRLEIDEVFNNRKSFQGHGTGGAIVLSPDRSKILLIHHKSSGKWMQPGGHWDPEDPNPWSVARREAQEETDVTISKMLPVLSARPHVPIDIGVHNIPVRPNKNEPAHVHYDFRYVFLAQSEELTLQESEITEAAWILLDSQDDRLTEVLPSVQKLHELNII